VREQQNLFKATEVLIEDKASGRVTRWQPSAINSWIGWVSMIAVWAFSRMVLSVAMLLRARPRSLPAATVTVGWSTTREMTFSQEFFRRLAQECSTRNVHAFAGNFVVVDGAAIDCGPRDIPFAWIFLKLVDRLCAPLTAGLLSPVPGDAALPRQKRSLLDRLYQALTTALDRPTRDRPCIFVEQREQNSRWCANVPAGLVLT
jgi:hypothetical protein